MIRKARWLIFDALAWALRRLHGVVSLPATHPAHRRDECPECRLVDFDRAAYAGGGLLLDALELLVAVSVANADGEGGHESLWDAVDSFVAAHIGRDQSGDAGAHDDTRIEGQA